MAGGFTLDGLGGWFIDGSRRRSVIRDWHQPAARPARLLEGAGLSISDLWAARSGRWVGSRVCRCLPIPIPPLQRLRPPRTPGHRRLAVGQPRQPGPGHRRVRRGRAALRHRPHSRRGEDRLAHRPQRPARPRLHQRRAVRRTDEPQGHLPRRHRGDLRRQEQLVGRLRAVGVHLVRPPRRAAARRRPRPVDLRRPRHHARRADQADHRLPASSNATTRRSARSRTRCWASSARSR